MLTKEKQTKHKKANRLGLTPKERLLRFAFMATQRCAFCGSRFHIVVHHEPPGNGKRNDRRAVPLCITCHVKRHLTTGPLVQKMRDTLSVKAREMDVVFVLCNILGVEYFNDIEMDKTK